MKNKRHKPHFWQNQETNNKMRREAAKLNRQRIGVQAIGIRDRMLQLQMPERTK